jgi:pimeloyl-ACP methyl ester carboxylesterase
VVVIPNAAHSPQREAPEVTLQAVADFANRVFRTHGEGRLQAA